MSDTSTAEPESPPEAEHVPEPTEAEPIAPPPAELVPAASAPVGSVIAELPVVPPGDEMRALAQLANTLAMAHVVPKDLRQKPNDVFAVLLSARDLGVALTTALREFHVIEGRVTLSPKVKLAMVRRSGLGRVWPAPDNGKLSATWYAERHDLPGHTVAQTFTWEDAQTAHLVDIRCTPDAHWKGSGSGRNSAECLCKSNWKTYPARMLSWRTLGYLLDDVFGEVGTGLYSPDELGAVTDADGEPIEVRAVESLPGMRGGSQPGGGGESEVEMISQDQLADLRPRVDAVKAHPEANPDLKAWWSERELPGLGKFTAAQARTLGAKLAQLEARFTIQPAEQPQEAPESDGEAQTPPEPPAEALGGAEGPATAPEAEPDDGTVPTSPPDGDVFDWLIRRAAALNAASILTAFTVSGEPVPETRELNALRRAWTYLEATRIMRGLVVALSGGTINPADLPAISDDEGQA